MKSERNTTSSKDSKHNRLLTYALRDNNLVHVKNVENGKDCLCICPFCKSELLAINNDDNIPVPHFRHSIPCEGAYESALHLLAKEVLKESKTLRIPNFHHDYDNQNEDSFFRSGFFIDFDSAEDEVDLGDIVPDIICHKGGSKLYVEFRNSHPIDAEKLAIIKNGDVSCIEIDIRKLNLDKEEIKAFLLQERDEIYYIFNPKLEEKYRKEYELIENERVKEEKEKNRLLEIQKEYEQKWYREFEMTIEKIEIKKGWDSYSRWYNPYYKVYLNSGLELPGPYGKGKLKSNIIHKICKETDNGNQLNKLHLEKCWKLRSERGSSAIDIIKDLTGVKVFAQTFINEHGYVAVATFRYLEG
jgi:hypothetical protein